MISLNARVELVNFFSLARGPSYAYFLGDRGGFFGSLSQGPTTCRHVDMSFRHRHPCRHFDILYSTRHTEPTWTWTCHMSQLSHVVRGLKTNEILAKNCRHCPLRGTPNMIYLRCECACERERECALVRFTSLPEAPFCLTIGSLENLD